MHRNTSKQLLALYYFMLKYKYTKKLEKSLFLSVCPFSSFFLLHSILAFFFSSQRLRQEKIDISIRNFSLTFFLSYFLLYISTHGCCLCANVRIIYSPQSRMYIHIYLYIMQEGKNISNKSSQQATTTKQHLFLSFSIFYIRFQFSSRILSTPRKMCLTCDDD